MRATRSSHYIVLDVITLIRSCEEYNCGDLRDFPQSPYISPLVPQLSVIRVFLFV
jgi:hypothetical protein